tara:strand:+ start:10526 stop:11764 length:1239 start_codon:yes stop_codon:yes gene_type:complete
MKINLNENLISIYFLTLFPLVYLTGPFLTEIFLLIIFFSRIKKLKGIKKVLASDNRLIQFFFIVIFFQSFLGLPEINLKNLLYVRFYFYYIAIRHLIQSDPLDSKKIKTFIFYFSLSLIILIIYNLFQSFTNFGTIDMRFTVPLRNEEIAVSIYTKFYPFILILFLASKTNFKELNVSNYKVNFIYTILLITPIMALMSGERMNTIMLIIFSFLAMLRFRIFLTLKIIFFIMIVWVIGIYYLEIHHEFFRLNYAIERYGSLIKLINKDFLENSIWGNHYLASIKIFEKNMLTGIGINNFQYSCEEYTSTLASACTSHPHNIFLEIAAETGLFGLILFVGICFQVLFKLIGYMKKTETSLTYIFLLAICICLAIYIFPIRSNGSFFNNYNSSFFWVYISLLFNINTKKIYEKK